LPPQALWPSRALVWQASDPYLYMRTTPDGRIVAGGEDEALTDAAQRDAMTDAKVAAIVEKLGRLLPGRRIEPAYAWSGFFGATEDSMPLIGPVPGMPHCLAAFGYGGNGITFSAIAAEMLGRMLAGEADPQAATFALDRVG
jgi:glycine/D-amino acid oxidase-like deaminating enzyme